MNDKYDIIVIGGGHNGLTAATKLAKNGKKVAVIEKRQALGGIAAGEEFHPGYKSTGLIHDTSTIRMSVVKSLNLKDFGLNIEEKRPNTTILGSSGECIELSDNIEETCQEISKYSNKDAEAYKDYRSFIASIRPFVDGLMNEMPPDLIKLGTKDLWTLLKKAIGLKRLGNKTMLEFLKVAPMSVADFINERFETEFLKAGLVAPAIYHSYTGPWSSYSTLNLLLWECASANSIIGGPQALVTALEKAAIAVNVDILTNCGAKQVLLDDNNEVMGVLLADDKVVQAPIVASSCTPLVTFYDLLKPNQIEYSLEHSIKHYRSRGTAVKVNLALNKALSLNGLSNIEYARTGNSIDEMEKSFDFVKYRKFSVTPILDIHVPSVSSPELAPENHCVVSVIAHFASHELEGGWSEDPKKVFGQNVIQTLEQYSPGISNSVVGMEVLSPQDLEERYGLANGQVYHGEHAVDQILTRPIPSCMRYSTPISGLYLCGSGSHPGGGITCMPGALGSEAILKNR